MKLAHLLFVASLVAAPAAYAQHDAMKDHEGAAKAATTTHQASGVVKSVNTDKGTLTIAHDPVPSLKWPAMTMNFKAKDKKLLQGMKPGAKVAFEFQQQGKEYVIVRIK